MEIIYTPLTMADSRAFYQIAGDERVAATMRFECPRTQTESDAILSDYLSAGNRCYGLRFPENPKFWGVFAFKSKPGSEEADLSLMIDPQQWGKGLGKQIIRDMIALARKEHWYKTLGAYILETNTASRRMSEGNGFSEIRRLRFPDMTEDLIVYRLEI